MTGFLFDNIGIIVSSKRIADSLTSDSRKTISITVENYINALTESFILYKAGQYNIKGSDRRYCQAEASVLDRATFAQEIAPRKAVKDNYPKSIISLDQLPMEEEGIRQINMLDFLQE